MNNFDLNVPQVGIVATFTFKKPFDVFVKNMLKMQSDSFKLEVNSVTSMKDYIRLSNRDPFTDVYTIVNLSELEYKQDLKDDVKIITFLFRDEYNTERLFRVPLTYVESMTGISSVDYINKGIYISLPPLPYDTTIDFLFEDIKDMIAGRLGVEATLKEISLSDISTVSVEEHEMRESIRKNSITVNKSNYVLLKEREFELTAIKERLDELGIQLGGQNVKHST